MTNPTVPTWKEIIAEALGTFPHGQATLNDLYPVVHRVAALRQKPLSQTVNDTTRRELQEHPDLFTQDVKRSGVWRLVTPPSGESQRSV